MIPNARLMNINPPGPISKAMCSSGPMARTVDDLKVCFDVLTNGSPDDCHYPKVLLSPEDSRPTVAVLRHETGAMLSHEIESKLDETIGVLRESGLKVLENVLPDLAEAPEVWANILGTELLQFVIPNVGKQINPGALVHIQDMFGPFNLGPDLAPYRQAWLKRIALMEILETTMEDYSVILSPVAGMPVPPVDFDELIPFQETQKLFASMRSVMWVNLFGLPAISLPNGMQLVGRRYSEATLFRIASLIEKHLPVVQIADPWNFASRI
jgi:amidase